MDRSAAMEHLSGAAAEAFGRAEEKFQAAKQRTSDGSVYSPRPSTQSLAVESNGQGRIQRVGLERLVQLPATAELQNELEVWTRALRELPGKRLPVDKHVQAHDDIRGRIKRLTAKLTDAEERDAIQATRPDGCSCLGTGLVPYWAAVKSGDRYCECDDGALVRSEALEELRAEAARTKVARVAELVGRINLPDFVTKDHLTLETFNPDPDQEYVYRQVLGAAASETGESFLLFGDASRGKSGLLATLLLRYVERFARPGKYWPATVLMDEITRQAHQPIGDEGDVLWSCGRIPFLMIDDIDKLRMTTAFAVERFYQLVNTRYEGRLVTLITTNMGIAQLTDKMEPYVVDRLISMCGGIHGGRALELRGENRRV